MSNLLLLLTLLGCKPTVDEDHPSATPIDSYDPVEYVNPFVGTGGPGASVGSINPGAATPFGMVQAGPASSMGVEAPFWHCAAYYYTDTHITGFVHTVVHGMGVTDMGGVAVMPKASFEPEYTSARDRMSAFDHDNEWASPGYYSVVLQDDGITAESTATPHGALHRWTYPADLPAPVALIDLHFVNGITDHIGASWIEIDPATGRVHGHQRLHGGYSSRFGGAMHHFDGYFDPAPVSVGTWVDPEETDAGSTRAENDEGGTGAWLVFPEGTTEVSLRIALSFVDVEGATGNLEAELPDFDFDARRAEAEQSWRDELGNVRVRSTHPDPALAERDRRLFHTSQYHTYQMPRIYSDVDGRFRGFDQEIHADPGFPFYSDFSGWDTFRTQHPWMILVRPGRQRDMNKSLIQMADDGGSLPRGPLAPGYPGGMVGTPMDQVLAGSYLKGVDGWDVDKAWDYAVEHATGPVAVAGRAGIDAYMERGYVTNEAAGGAAARTLEFAWSDGALARWGEAMGSPEAAQLREQSGNWANTFDAESGFFYGRYEDGSFDRAGEPYDWHGSFVEGSAWQYLWMVPQDAVGMVDVQHGGDLDAFLVRYDEFWDLSYTEEDDYLPDLYYWHGNEPDIHYAFMASLLGRPDHSADPARYVLETKYHDAGAGIDGNDDGGTLSAYYLLASIGVFPVAGTVDYAIGSPIFERVEIDLDDGGQLVIRAPDTSPTARYVQSAELGGVELGTSVITHDQLLSGEELVLWMGAQRQGWGSGE